MSCLPARNKGQALVQVASVHFNIFKVRPILYEGSSANEAESKRRTGKWKGLRRKGGRGRVR